MTRLMALVLITGTVTACTSPEATRTRAGGPGADVGNHGPMELHGGSKPYYGTPTSGPTLVPPARGSAIAATTRK